VVISVPVLTADNVRKVVDTILLNAEDYFQRTAPAEVLAAMSNASSRWCNPTYGPRETALAVLPKTTGFSYEMIQDFGLGVFQMSGPLERFGSSLQQIREHRRSDGDHFAPVDKGLVKAFGTKIEERHEYPSLITHVLSGNVVGYTALTLLMGLPLNAGEGCAQLVKLPREDPVFMLLYGQSIEEVSPELRRTMAIGYWRGGSQDVERHVFRRTDIIDVLGSDTTISSVAAAAKKANRQVRVFAHGHKTGFAIIGHDSLDSGTTGALPMDICQWDGGACFDVKTVYVEGNVEAAADFARRLSAAMIEFGAKYPIGEQLQRSKWQLTAEILASTMRNRDVQAFVPPDRSHAVVCSADPDYELVGHPFRTVVVKPVSSVHVVPELIGRRREALQTVVVAVGGDDVLQLAEALGTRGASNIHGVGKGGYFELWEPRDGKYESLDLTAPDGRHWVSLCTAEAASAGIATPSA